MLFAFLPPIQLTFEIESIKRGPAKALQYYAAFFQGSVNKMLTRLR